MLRTVTLLALAMAAPLAAQSPAKATLFTRTEGQVVRAAIQIEIQPGWHIYHKELGHPKAVGQPTTVTFNGEGIEWSEVRFPEPIKLDQSDIAGEGAFILAHENEAVLYAAGTLAAGATTDALEVKVKGLVCSDVQGCIPFKQTLKSEGPGADALFASFPADLVSSAPSANSAAAAPAAAPTQASAREDVLRGEHVDATLYTRRVGDELRAAIQFELDPEWHLYHTADDLGKDAIGKPTKIELRGASFESPRFPKPVRLDQSFAGEGAYINAHEGTFVVYARAALAAGASAPSVEAEIDGQVCASSCVNYHELAYDRGAGPDDVWSEWSARFAAPQPPAGTSAAATTPDPALGASAAPAEDAGLLRFLLLAIAGGLFALVMPCTYPMIPITISFFTKQAEKRGGTPLALSLAYGAGIVLIFVVVGVVFGSLVIPFAANPITNLVIGLAFVYFALVLFGWLNLQPPRFLLNLAGTASMKGGYAGVFLMGATLVVTSFTCTAPFVGSLLSFGARGGSLTRVALGMAVFGLTMAVPFVILSLVPGRIRAIPRSGEWMNTLKVFFGFIELAAALKFVSNADRVWEWNVLSRELFLLLWGVLFLVAAVYLFGVLSRGVEVGARRRLGGAATLAFAAYCFWGMSGRNLDYVMTAFAPPYSGGVLGWKWYDAGENWSLVRDDYDAALELARKEKKLLLVNFTGLTCANCISNELHVFPEPSVAKELREHFVEARLHTDGEHNIERILQLQQELARSVATPLYLIQDPSTKRQLNDSLGGLTSADAFRKFLQTAREAREKVGRLELR